MTPEVIGLTELSQGWIWVNDVAVLDSTVYVSKTSRIEVYNVSDPMNLEYVRRIEFQPWVECREVAAPFAYVEQCEAITIIVVSNPWQPGIVNFFFSSRRQHTSWNCDWSSDVCSSDLCEPTGANDPTCSSQCVRIDSTGTAYLFTFDQDPQGWTLYATSPERLESGSSVAYDAQNRSEERRVGKEWRAWSLWYREITKT